MLYQIKRIKNRIAFLLVFCMAFSNWSFAFANDFSDIANHWAKSEIESWIEKGFVKGYEDGTFKPNKNVSRAEFMAMVNNASGFTKQDAVSYSDVPANAWFYSEVAKAKAAGYISGYTDGTIKPNSPISRQEAASIIVRLLGLQPDSQEAVKFADYNKMPEWSKGPIGAVAAAQIMGGYTDSTFKGENAIKRAEAVVALGKAMAQIPAKATEAPKEEPKDNKVVPSSGSSSSSSGSGSSTSTNTYSQPGTYGPATGNQTIYGNVVINSKDVILRNVTITGNLTLHASIGDGDATLRGVTVQGNTYVNGGGANSIHFEDSILLTVIVNKNNGTVRIVATGATSVTEVQLESSAIVAESGLTGGATGFSAVSLAASMPANADVELQGTFETVNTRATNVRLTLSEGTSVESLILDALARVVGTGTITNATINANGSTLSSLPTATLVIPSGVTAEIGGVQYDHSTVFVPSTTLESIKITLASIQINLADHIIGNTKDDFVVTAALDGAPYEIQNLEYHANMNRFTFTPVSLEGNIGKTFAVTVARAAGSTKVGGSAKTHTVTVKSGFEGRITDIYGVGVEDMTIKFRAGVGNTEGDVVKTAVTGKYGYYSVELEPGMYTGELEKSGFLTTYVVATSLTGVYNVGQNETAIRVAREGEIKIVLTWDEHPRDLDSHLVGPTPDGDRFRTWYGEKTYSYNGEVYADLDWDDTDSYGPETTTIRKVIDGTYQFYVHHFSGENTLRTSSAKVEVYKGTELLQTYNVPTGEGSETYWIAFDMTIDGNNIDFTRIDAMTNSMTEQLFINHDNPTTTSGSIIMLSEVTTGSVIALSGTTTESVINLNGTATTGSILTITQTSNGQPVSQIPMNTGEETHWASQVTLYIGENRFSFVVSKDGEYATARDIIITRE